MYVHLFILDKKLNNRNVLSRHYYTSIPPRANGSVGHTTMIRVPEVNKYGICFD